MAVTFGTSELPDFAVIEVGAGRFFSAIEASHNAPVVVVNYALARELAPGRDPLEMVGQNIQLSGRVRRIVGVLARNQYEEPEFPDFAVYAPIRSAEALLSRPVVDASPRRFSSRLRRSRRSLRSGMRPWTGWLGAMSTGRAG